MVICYIALVSLPFTTLYFTVGSPVVPHAVLPRPSLIRYAGLLPFGSDFGIAYRFGCYLPVTTLCRTPFYLRFTFCSAQFFTAFPPRSLLRAFVLTLRLLYLPRSLVTFGWLFCSSPFLPFLFVFCGWFAAHCVRCARVLPPPTAAAVITTVCCNIALVAFFCVPRSVCCAFAHYVPSYRITYSCCRYWRGGHGLCLLRLSVGLYARCITLRFIWFIGSYYFTALLVTFAVG